MKCYQDVKVVPTEEPKEETQEFYYSTENK